MKKTNINRYKNGREHSNIVHSNIAATGAKGFISIVWKIISTILLIFLISCLVVGISLGIYLFGLASQPTGIDLQSEKVQLTTFIYTYDKNGNPVEYQRIHDTEDRVWVDFDDIPQQMKDAMVAIEDKRFYDHSGVDWVRTIGAILNLGSGESSYGGSTLTQQLIKNISGDNDVSITRKLNEIFRALNLERDFTKDEILEAYLNVVNFGSGRLGVQSAANLYFAKDIQDCSIAECAAIAGITQNPAAYNPLVNPDDNKVRRDTVIDAMYEQGMITKEEYAQAQKESENMTFVGYENNAKEKENEDKNDDDIPNWYIEALYRDLQNDLQQELNLSEDAAERKIYTGGLKIYCAMDESLQTFAENYLLNVETPYDPNMEIATVVMGLDGRILATVGSREEKEGMLVWDRANTATFQPGSSIKPVCVYPLAIEKDIYHYSSLVKDQPIEQWTYSDGVWKSGPNNVYGSYLGEITLPDAIERSSNATAAQTMELVGAKNAYDQAINKMGFRNLSTEDAENLGALSLGGLNGGVTVREMAAAYQYMGNGGRYYKPYTYYYVTDNEDNVLIDNRENIPIQAYSEETASIMNRLLHYNVVNNNPSHTSAGQARIAGWDILGKTGTTDSDKDHWFVGLSPYATCAVWTGYDTPASISQSSFTHAVDIFHDLMEEYLKDKEEKEFTLSDNLETETYCASTGLLATSYCSNTFTGYYKPDNKPDYCSGYHSGYYSGGSNTSSDYYSNYSSNYGDDDDDDDDYSSSSSDDYSSSSGYGDDDDSSSESDDNYGDANSSPDDNYGSSTGDGGTESSSYQ